MQADLAIVIPTYNRARTVGMTLLKHCNILESLRIKNVDVVVSVNPPADPATPDGTASVVEGLAARFPFVKMIRQPRHYDTAEEHIYRACAAINYKYVWLFGDDDIPLPAGLLKVMPALLCDDFDFVICNMKSISATTGNIMPGRNAADGLVEANANIEGRVDDIISRVGFQSVSACVSAVAFNRQIFMQGSFERFFEISPIYSHVATYLHAFKDKRCLFIAEPVFMYNYGATRNDNWIRFSRRRKQHGARPWTSGIAGLMRELRRQNCISNNFLVNTREHDPKHIYSLFAHMLSVTLSSIEASLAQESAIMLLDEGDISIIAGELNASDSSTKSVMIADRLVKLSRVLRASFGGYGVETLTSGQECLNQPLSIQSLPALFRCLDSEAKTSILAHIKDWAAHEISALRSAIEL